MALPRSCHRLVVSYLLLASAACSNNATARSVADRPQAATSRKPTPARSPESAVAQTGPHHPVFSLVDSRMLAHLSSQGGRGVVVLAGHPGVAKYLNFGRPWRSWAINERVDGDPVALAVRNVSWLSIPLLPEQATAAKVITLRLRGASAQGLRLEVNDKPTEAVRINADWQRVQVAVPPGALRPGENLITFRWGGQGRINNQRAWAALQWLHLGPSSPDEQTRVAIRDPQGRLWLPPDGGLAYYIHPYAGAKLLLRFGALPTGQRCELVVSMRTEEASAKKIEVVREFGAQAGEHETLVDLAPVADRVSRLELRARGTTCRQGIALAKAEIVMPGRAPIVQRPKKPRHVLFWMIDNVRADCFRAYDPKTRVKTPVFDRLVATGALFERAYIQGTESRVSHAAIWTGLYPKQHRFIAPKAKLSPSWVTLPEAVRKAGLFTAAWIANGFVSEFWGFGRGWDSFRNTLHKGGGLHAEALADHAIKFIEARGDRPFYLYVGTIDPHVNASHRSPSVIRYSRQSTPLSCSTSCTRAGPPDSSTRWKGCDATARGSWRLALT